MRTTTTRAGSGPMPNRVESAKAPLTLLVANQPTPAVIDIRVDGTALPLNPNGRRPNTIWGTPCRGPRADRTPCARTPRPAPSRMPAAACQKFIP